jgi:dephospho-CoA kinase
VYDEASDRRQSGPVYVRTSDAKATYESLRDLAEEAGSKPVKIKGIRDQAVFAEIPSFKELLVLKGKTFLFLRLLDIQSTVDAATAQTAMTQLGKAAAKRV